MSRALRLIPALIAPLLLAGCSLLGGSKDAPALYAPEPAPQVEAGWPAANWHLTVAASTQLPLLDDQPMLVSPRPGELQVYRGARWARAPRVMVEDAVLRTLEASGKLQAVARQGSGLAADYRLLLDLRSFRSDYGDTGTPAAVIEVQAQLLRLSDRSLLASRSFRQQQPAAGSALPQVNAAFAGALAALGHDIAGWTLETAAAH